MTNLNNLTFTTLPTENDFDNAHKNPLEYAYIGQNQWSEPKFVCPNCNEGGMCKDLTTILTSNPPSFKYQCNKCGHVTYKHY